MGWPLRAIGVRGGARGAMPPAENSARPQAERGVGDQAQRRVGRERPDALAIAAELEVPGDGLLALLRDRDPDRADRLLVGAAAGPRDAGDGDRDVGVLEAERALGHRARDLFADRPVRA